MSAEKFDISLREHIKSHPGLQAQDIIKFCHQALFGAEHLLSDVSSAKKYFDEEYAAAAPSSALPLREYLDDRYSRVNFAVWKEYGFDREELFRMFADTAKSSASDTEERKEEYFRIAGQDIVGLTQIHLSTWKEALNTYIADGCAPVHHSERYREIYSPSYRVARSDLLDAYLAQTAPLLSDAKLTNEHILRAAMEQSAIDAGCRAEDFTKRENVIVTSTDDPEARKYLKLPHVCNLISYGSNIVAAIDEKYRSLVTDYIGRYSKEHCFETPNLHVLNDRFQEDGFRVCFMAEYFLPDMNVIKALPCEYELKLLHHKDFADLYTPEWSNALCADRAGLDVLGVGAYDGEKLIGLAGCSADCGGMWQIGIDVLPEYRRRGIASALTSRLALEIIARGKIPFYCCAWSNVASARNALRSGFRPAWVELTVKPAETVDEMNR